MAHSHTNTEHDAIKGIGIVTLSDVSQPLQTTRLYIYDLFLLAMDIWYSTCKLYYIGEGKLTARLCARSRDRWRWSDVRTFRSSLQQKVEITTLIRHISVQNESCHTSSIYWSRYHCPFNFSSSWIVIDKAGCSSSCFPWAGSFSITCIVHFTFLLLYILTLQNYFVIF